MKTFIVSLLMSALMAMGCDEKVDPIKSGDDSDSDRDAATGPITYTEHIAPIFDRNCVRCHSSELGGKDRNGAPQNVDFDTYENSKDNAISARGVIQAGVMPPAKPLPDNEQALVGYWIDDGLLE